MLVQSNTELDFLGLFSIFSKNSLLLGYYFSQAWTEGIWDLDVEYKRGVEILIVQGESLHCWWDGSTYQKNHFKRHFPNLDNMDHVDLDVLCKILSLNCHACANRPLIITHRSDSNTFSRIARTIWSLASISGTSFHRSQSIQKAFLPGDPKTGPFYPWGLEEGTKTEVYSTNLIARQTGF